MKILILCVLAYFIGSIPFGFLLSTYVFKKDVRTLGSGNIGATNIGRNFGKKAYGVILILDILKGVIALSLTRISYFSEVPEILIAISVICGHVFSCFLNFKGGKGVATTVGTILFINPIIFCIMATTFLTTVFTTRIISLSAMMNVVILGIVGWIFKDTTIFLLGLFLTPFFMYTHRENIKRLINGNENRIFQKKSS